MLCKPPSVVVDDVAGAVDAVVGMVVAGAAEPAVLVVVVDVAGLLESTTSVVGHVPQLTGQAISAPSAAATCGQV